MNVALALRDHVEQMPVWKRLTLCGQFATAAAYLAVFARRRRYLTDCARRMLPMVIFGTAPAEMLLVVRRVSDLGFTEPASYRDICERARMLGLALCPAEVGLMLRLELSSKRKGGWLVIAMKPILVGERDPRIFALGYCHWGRWGLLLCGADARDARKWPLDERFVFQLLAAAA